jgi:hypothetical protein
VWATANTREALWDAMKRREPYGTSATRMTVCFFGGWDFAPGDVRSRQLADIGYRKGVPMGGDLKAEPRRVEVLWQGPLAQGQPLPLTPVVPADGRLLIVRARRRRPLGPYWTIERTVAMVGG